MPATDKPFDPDTATIGEALSYGSDETKPYPHLPIKPTTPRGVLIGALVEAVTDRDESHHVVTAFKKKIDEAEELIGHLMTGIRKVDNGTIHEEKADG